MRGYGGTDTIFFRFIFDFLRGGTDIFERIVFVLFNEVGGGTDTFTANYPPWNKVGRGGGRHMHKLVTYKGTYNLRANTTLA